MLQQLLIQLQDENSPDSTQQSSRVTWCSFACKWDASSRVTWSSYFTAVTHFCSIPRFLSR